MEDHMMIWTAMQSHLQQVCQHLIHFLLLLLLYHTTFVQLLHTGGENIPSLTKLRVIQKHVKYNVFYVCNYLQGDHYGNKVNFQKCML